MVLRIPVKIEWAGSGSPGVNVWHGRTDAPSGTLQDSQIQAMVDALHTFYGAVQAVMPGGTKITLDQVSDVQTQAGYAPSWTTIVGSSVTSLAPPALQICIGWKTSLVARRGKGRTFIGPLAGNVMEADGSPLATSLAVVSDNAQTLVNASLADNGWALGIWGLVNAQPRGVLPTSTTPRVLRDLTGRAVKDKFAVLRSRRD